MKSFKRYLFEDIMAGHDPDDPEIIHKSRKKLIPDMESLVKAIGPNYSPSETTKTIKLDDDFHATIDHTQGSLDPKIQYMNVRVFSSKPGHERTSLMHYSLSSGSTDFFHTEDGRAVRMFSGTPHKNRTDVKKGVFKLPANLLHAVSDATGFGVVSGGMQSKGGVSMWRKAVKHGHRSGNRVHRILQLGANERYPGEKIGERVLSWKSYGHVTPRNFSDAYSLDVSRRKTGNRSKVPSGRMKDAAQDQQRVQDQIKMGNRTDSRLLVLPRVPK
jgi:hypothetical protein